MIIFAFYLQPIFGLSSAYLPQKRCCGGKREKMLILVKEYDIVQMPR